ncbi:TIGR00270 family protein [Candidatus Bathyarchaeota archaeon]|nr:TIGR00270 family protein [Candidatus Bathyarchaeota archaeon]
MRCEVCGRKIYGKSHRAVIEGAKLTVCSECAKHGTATWEEPIPKIPASKPKATHQPLKIQSKKQTETAIDTSLELTGNFDQKIRQAREKLGLSHEDLGKKINEKVSLLRKIETRKMTPDNKLVTKLEYALKIKLLTPFTEEKIPQRNIPKQTNRELTLGDLIELNKKRKGEPEERKLS